MNKLIEDEGLHLAYLLGKSDGIKQGRAEVIDELVRPLQNRCFALTQGQMCFFCPMECEHRKTKFRNDEQLKEQNK